MNDLIKQNVYLIYHVYVGLDHILFNMQAQPYHCTNVIKKHDLDLVGG